MNGIETRWMAMEIERELALARAERLGWLRLPERQGRPRWSKVVVPLRLLRLPRTSRTQPVRGPVTPFSGDERGRVATGNR